MKQRPILFSTLMVLALLDGRKTQTRRIIKPQPDTTDGRPLEVWYGWPSLARSGADYHNITPPYGRPGDGLWVRETLYYDDHSGDEWCYQAGNSPVTCDYEGILTRTDKVAIPSIHMPRIACRLELELTNVRVERLQDISEQDAIAEGIEQLAPWPECPERPRYRVYSPPSNNDGLSPTLATFDPRFSYFSLWEMLNGAGSVRDNPYIWVIDFKTIKQPS